MALLQNPHVTPPPPADLPAVVDAFRRCRRADGTLATDHYLAAVNELVRLFQSFGKGLELSLKGVEKPITALELLRVRGASYSSFDLLLRHERESPDVDPRGSKSGTVSSALLHQYLEFMLEFLTKLEEAVEKNTNFAAGDKVNIYQNTTARHHAAYVQVTVKMLLLRTPGTHALLLRLGHAARGEASPREILRSVLSRAAPVHERLAQLLAQQ